MTVHRDEEGFHVVLPSAPEFTAQPLFKGTEMLPIASIEVSKDRWTPGSAYSDALSQAMLLISGQHICARAELDHID